MIARSTALLVTLAVVLAGCSGAALSPSPDSPTPTASPTASPTVTESPSQTPTATSSPTATPTPTPTATPTPTPTERPNSGGSGGGYSPPPSTPTPSNPPTVSLEPVRSNGTAVTNTTLFNFTDGVEARFDFLNDSANYTRIATADDRDPQSDTIREWSAAGAPSIARGPNGTWYAVVRQRTTVDDERGKSFEIYRSDNATGNWSLLFAEDMTDDARSVEGSSLRFYNGTWYLYFSHDIGPSHNWRVSHVTADNISDLQPALDDPATWNRFADTGFKDPTVVRSNGSYLMFLSTCCPSKTALFESTAGGPEFDEYYHHGNPTAPAQNQGVPPGNTGTLLYQNGTFVWWYSWHDSSLRAHWGFVTASSPRDLPTGTYAGSILVDTGGNSSGSARYMSTYTVGSRQMFVMEWDPDRDDVHDTYLWGYVDT